MNPALWPSSSVNPRPLPNSVTSATGCSSPVASTFAAGWTPGFCQSSSVVLNGGTPRVIGWSATGLTVNRCGAPWPVSPSFHHAPAMCWYSGQSKNDELPAWTATNPLPLRTKSKNAVRVASGQFVPAGWPQVFQSLTSTSYLASVAASHCSGCSVSSTAKRPPASRNAFSLGVVSFQLWLFWPVKSSARRPSAAADRPASNPRISEMTTSRFPFIGSTSRSQEGMLV